MDDFFERWPICDKCGRPLMLAPKDNGEYYIYCPVCGTCRVWRKEEWSKECNYGIAPTVMGDLPL